MAVSLSAITKKRAKKYLKKHSSFRGKFNLCIAAITKRGKICGVIVVKARRKFKLRHISTDGSAMIGSLLYGAAWRAAKALGYETITI